MYFIILVDKFWSIETSGLNELLNLIMVSLTHLFEVQSLKALLYINLTIIFLYICCIFVFYSLDAKSWMFTDDAEWYGQPRPGRGWQENQLDCQLPSSDHDPGRDSVTLLFHWRSWKLQAHQGQSHRYCSKLAPTTT